MTEPPLLELYPMARPRFWPQEPDGFSEAVAGYESAAEAYHQGRFHIAADRFLAAAQDFRRCAPGEAGLRTLAYWNALVSWASLGDRASALRLVLATRTSDTACAPAVADVADDLLGS